MFERFTRDARAAVMGAVGEAERRGDRHIGTEHILLALCARSAPDPASLLLHALGVDADHLRSDVERRLQRAA